VVFSFAIQRVKKKVNRVFVYYLGLAAFWSFTSFMVRQQADPELSLFWNRILAVSLVAGLVVYFHFVRLYTGRSPGWGVYLGYVCVPVLIVISITTDWVIKSSHVDNGLLHHELGGAIYVIGALSLLYTFSVLYLLGQKYLQSKDPIDRNRTAYLLAGWG
jgi:NADH:ubiquinone oxidoreductase subunit 6 (subunit J)